MRTLEELIAIILTDPNKFYQTPEWKTKRLEMLARDHYECKRCIGEWKSNVPTKHFRLRRSKYVHHIKSLKEHPELCITDDNLVSLCFKCHEEVEQRGFSANKKIPLTFERW